MPRSLPEWIGKTDDTAPPASVKARIVERQGGVSALSGLPFDAKSKPQFDHKVPLWLGGENRESNLHAIRPDEHSAKTAAEAKVRAKVNANRNSHLGIRVAKSRPIPKPIKTVSPRTARNRDNPKQTLPPRNLFEATP